MVVSHF